MTAGTRSIVDQAGGLSHDLPGTIAVFRLLPNFMWLAISARLAA
jgi:hypothetical protein